MKKRVFRERAKESATNIINNEIEALKKVNIKVVSQVKSEKNREQRRVSKKKESK